MTSASRSSGGKSSPRAAGVDDASRNVMVSSQFSLAPREPAGGPRRSRRESSTRSRAPAACYTRPVRADPLLSGLVVLDLTRVLAGPYCTRLLADLGARVVKIEQPGRGDEMRRGPHQLESDREDQSTYFIRCNAGKESVALDLTRPEARTVVLDLVRAADVVVENFAPGVAARLGSDHAALAAVKPDLVYCSISGYGQTGPWR